MNTAPARLPAGRFSIPFTNLKNSVLGLDFELSLVFVDNIFSKRLNRTYRGKNKSADVLSFPLSKKSGEIFIDLITAKKEMGKFQMPYRKFVTFLFIHGLLHLKGMKHGTTMERREKKLLNDASNYSRYRHRDL
ncbi:MAG: rRNA maturation RNase YbeY [Candidatus Zambryskibacteria bacterium CG11_big_fil_rev_8_21_14_0_20_42_18]|uniref:Endoribonuclease YbeY n=1 Tax=Candidatus Zambryskibacteria bacterium CG_4_9_14_3_um_filter_42_15 TaxID=1975112 RepID=A0A2M7WS96_9BACT|nr:MAG: rRNA maturation RNase YbeY [Candidatus Zambryskibacteria bacterium CG11_big_fil_rev_8_21_14_0_20_42_18]PJA32868.1 MAG: rRNA maturation RNase YbeY [Candidatus Zambryskibacteria bacterium CG_4_9_14_3_um_filter_42_15]